MLHPDYPTECNYETLRECTNQVFIDLEKQTVAGRSRKKRIEITINKWWVLSFSFPPMISLPDLGKKPEMQSRHGDTDRENSRRSPTHLTQKAEKGAPDTYNIMEISIPIYFFFCSILFCPSPQVILWLRYQWQTQEPARAKTTREETLFPNQWNCSLKRVGKTPRFFLLSLCS